MHFTSFLSKPKMSVSFSVIKLKFLRRDVWNRTTDLKWYIQTQFMCSSFVWFECLVGTNEWQKGISNSLFSTFRNQLWTLAHPPMPSSPPLNMGGLNVILCTNQLPQMTTTVAHSFYDYEWVCESVFETTPKDKTIFPQSLPSLCGFFLA